MEVTDEIDRLAKLGAFRVFLPRRFAAPGAGRGVGRGGR